ncbi:transposase [uncultured Fusobacterium sp.]|uniref:IS91 family transposase n=1 Tax=uncultured Fusobacterium sp. TaxID=159267 RepID=UPI003451F207
MTVIHTFGRDLKWNPHIHAIVTLGGLNKKYFHIDSIAGQWKKLVIDIVKSGNYKNKNLKKKAQIITFSLYKKDTRFFFEVAKNDLNNNASAIKYIGRYLSHAPIAEYKIRDFSDNKVTFYYEDLFNNKEKIEITIDVEKFLSKLIIHIPPKNFKMIRRFGIYSRNIKTELKFIISRMKKYKSQYTKTTFYQLEI